MSFLDDDDEDVASPPVPAPIPAALVARVQGQSPLTPAGDYSIQLASENERLEAQNLSGVRRRRGSVFDLEEVMEDLYTRIKTILSNVTGRDELELAAAGELRQIARLAKDVMKDAAYLNGIKKQHEEEIQVLVQAVQMASPAMAKEIQENLVKLKQARRGYDLG